MPPLTVADAVLQAKHWVRPVPPPPQGSWDERVWEACARLNAVYIHVPKAGGVSVKTALFGGRGLGHYTVADYKRRLGPIEYRRRFSFTFVRSPYARLVSAFTFLQSGGLGGQDLRFAKAYLGRTSFEEFVMDWLTPERMELIVHLRPQVHFVCHAGQVAVDFVGRHESMESDFDYVACRLGVDAKLPHNNRTARSRPAASFLSPSVKARIAELYTMDFDTFAYEV